MTVFNEDQEYSGPFKVLSKFVENQRFQGVTEAICECLDISQAFEKNSLTSEIVELLKQSRNISAKLKKIQQNHQDEISADPYAQHSLQSFNQGGKPDFSSVSEDEVEPEDLSFVPVADETDFSAIKSSGVQDQIEELFEAREGLYSDLKTFLKEAESEVTELIEESPSEFPLGLPDREGYKYLLSLKYRRPTNLSAMSPLPEVNEKAIEFALKLPKWNASDHQMSLIVVRTKQILENFLCRNIFMASTVKKLIEVIEEDFLQDEHFFSRLAYLRQDRNYLFPHILNSLILSIFLARKLDYSEEEKQNLAYSALVFDLGMLRVVTLWSTELSLSESESKLIKKHPAYSEKLLNQSNFGFDRQVLNAAKNHHERLDGTGYPNQLTGSKISEMTQIVSLVDVFEALQSNRIHREGMAVRDIFDYLEESYTKFNNELVEILKKELGIYPPGTVLQLSNDEIVVVDKTEENPERPNVKLVMDNTGDPYDNDEQLDLSSNHDVEVVQVLGNYHRIPDLEL